jgi:bifunctional non-homologous end joining protein LigD
MPKRKLDKAAVKAPMLHRFEPMLPTLVQKPFSSQQWLFEPKWDGWRAMCFIRDGEARHLPAKNEREGVLALSWLT